VSAGLAGVWTAVGATALGTAHIKQGLPCQDALQYTTLAGGSLLAVVADGAGTAELSEMGSRCAVDTALSWLVGKLEQDAPEECCAWLELFAETFRQAREAVLRLADEQGETPRSFATTLTCAAATSDRLVVGQIGDGAVVGRGINGKLFTITHMQRGEYANETNFLTQDDALEQVIIDVIDEPIDGLAVMSDGLTRLALNLPSKEPHAPFFQPLFAFVEAGAKNLNGNQAEKKLAAFLASERVCLRTDDDKSLLLAVRAPEDSTPD
jgi:serine/threonine protein phosphatase PrpC